MMMTDEERARLREGIARQVRITPGQEKLLREVRLRWGKRLFGEACEHCGRRFL